MAKPTRPPHKVSATIPPPLTLLNRVAFAPGVCDMPHGSLLYNGRLYFTNVSNSSWTTILSVNPANFADFAYVEFPHPAGELGDNYHYQAPSMCQLGGKVYVMFQNGGTHTLVLTEVDPVTLDNSDVVNIPGVLVGAGSMTTDGTSIFVLLQTTAEIYKFTPGDWGNPEIFTLGESFQYGHALRFDGGFLYATGQAGMLARLKPDFSQVDYWPIRTLATDDFAITVDSLWIGFEENSGVVSRVNRDTGAVTEIKVLQNQNCYGLQEDGHVVWGVYTNGTGGEVPAIVRINPTDNSFVVIPLHSTDPNPNEILADGTNLYITGFSTPMVLWSFAKSNRVADITVFVEPLFPSP